MAKIDDYYCTEKNNYKHSIVRIEATILMGTLENVVTHTTGALTNPRTYTIDDFAKLIVSKYELPEGTHVRIDSINMEMKY